MSDSHGQHARVACAVRVLEAAGAEALVHCGDVGGLRVLDELAGRAAHVVWGNTDAHEMGLEAYARRLGVNAAEAPPLRLELGGKRIAVMHGHERVFEWLVGRHLDGAEVAEDYILHGHTHAACDARLPSGARLINPGALQRAAVYTAATLDLARDELRYWAIDETAPAGVPPQPIELA